MIQAGSYPGIPKGVFFFSLLFLCSGHLHSQVQNDFQSWTGIQLNKDLPKKFSAGASIQMRRFNNFSMLRSVYGQLDVSYKLQKHIFVSAGVRYIYTNSINSTRLFNDWTLKYELDLDAIGLDKFKLGLSGRLRLQYQFTNIPEPGLTIRPKVKAQLLRKKWKILPYIAYENYFGQKYDNFEFGRVRFYAGADIDLKKDFSLSVAYIWQKPFNSVSPVNANIISLNLEYNWDKKKKKKKPAEEALP